MVRSITEILRYCKTVYKQKHCSRCSSYFRHRSLVASIKVRPLHDFQAVTLQSWSWRAGFVFQVITYDLLGLTDGCSSCSSMEWEPFPAFPVLRGLLHFLQEPAMRVFERFEKMNDFTVNHVVLDIIPYNLVCHLRNLSVACKGRERSCWQ